MNNMFFPRASYECSFLSSVMRDRLCEGSISVLDRLVVIRMEDYLSEHFTAVGGTRSSSLIIRRVDLKCTTTIRE